MNRVRITMGLFICLVAVTGCSLLGGRAHREPQTIVVRNATDSTIMQVMIWSLDVSENDGPRMASLSAVLRGHSAVMARPNNPPPLPDKGRFAWVDAQGRTHAQDVDVSKALKSSTGEDGEVLLFEVLRDDSLSVQVGTFR